MLRDVAHAIRALRRAPAFTLAAIATLALAIGASSTLLSVVDQVLVRPLPYDRADRLFNIFERNPKGGYRLPSYPAFLDLRRDARTLSGLAYIRGSGETLRTSEGPEHITVAWVTPGFFSVLGARAELGRVFSPQEERGTASGVGVLSHSYWLSEFGGDPKVIGRTIEFDGNSLQVIGVMPTGVAFPDFANVWTPIAARFATDSALGSRFLHADARVIGRLAPGVTRVQAIAELSAIEQRLSAVYPEPSGSWSMADLEPLTNEVIGDATPMLLILAAAVGVVLLIACVNVSNLALIRAIGREREAAVRTALGATRRRLVWQLFLSESLLIAVTSGALGSLLTVWAIRALRANAPAKLPRAAELTVDARVLAIALALTTIAAVLVGLAPSLRRGAGRVAEQLRDGRLAASGGTRAVSMRNALGVAQLALAITLVVSTALLFESFHRVQQVNLGFDPGHVVGFGFDAPARYAKAADAAALYGRMLEAVRAVPGVTSVGFINHPPLTRGYVPTHIVVPGRSTDRGTADDALYQTVSGDYFRTMGMRMVRGRSWTEAEIASASDGVVVSESVAKHFWPDRDPVGQPLTVFAASQVRPDFGQPQPSHVIGVASDVRQFGQGEDPPDEVYLPYTRETWPFQSVVVRATGDPMMLAPKIREAVRALDPGIVISRVNGRSGFALMTDALSETLTSRRYVMWLLGGFASCALLLALIGVYGVVAYGVKQRTYEIGVRMALGADSREVFSMVLSQAIRLAAAGIVAGLALSVAATRVLHSQLYGTSPTDPLAMALSVTAVAATVFAACLPPAVRAAHVDPLVAMRGEAAPV